MPAGPVPVSDHRRAGGQRRAARAGSGRSGAGVRGGAADPGAAVVPGASGTLRPSRAPGHFDQWMMLELASRPDPAALAAALERPGRPPRRAADAVRARAGDSWQQHNPPPGRRRPDRCWSAVTCPRLRPRRRSRPPSTRRPGRSTPASTWPPGRCCARCCSTAAGQRPAAAAGRPPPGHRRRVLADPARGPDHRLPAGSRRDRPSTCPQDHLVPRLGPALQARARGGGFDDELAHWARVTSDAAGHAARRQRRAQHHRLRRVGHRQPHPGPRPAPCCTRYPPPTAPRSTTSCSPRWPAP